MRPPLLSCLALLALLPCAPCLLSVTADSACQWNSPGGLYDFSSLERFDFSGGTAPDTGVIVALSVCSGLADREAAPCAATATTSVNGSISACSVASNGVAATYGFWQPAAQPLNWSYILPNYPEFGVQYTMVGEAINSQGQEFYSMQVQLICDESTGGLVVTPGPQYSWTLSVALKTPLACKPAWQPTKCGYFGVSYAALMGQDIPGTDGSSDYKYYLSVCGALSSAAPCTATVQPSQLAAAACQTSTDSYLSAADANVVTGLYSPDPASLVWSFMDPTNPTFGTQYTQRSNVQCPAGQSGQTYTTVVQFICNTQGDSLPMRVYSAPFHCVFTYTIQTPLACAKPWGLGSSADDAASASLLAQQARQDEGEEDGVLRLL